MPLASESSGDAEDTTTGMDMADTMMPADADTGSSGTSGTSGTTAEPPDGTTTMSMVDPTEGMDSTSTTDDMSDSTTDADTDPTTTTDDGGCDPGVFGVSQFGDACFQ